MDEWSRGYTLIAGPGEEKTIDAITMEQHVRLRKIQVSFPQGAAGELEVAVLYGNRRIAPTEGTISGDGSTFTFEVDIPYHKGSSIKIYYKNSNTTEQKRAYFLFAGEPY